MDYKIDDNMRYKIFETLKDLCDYNQYASRAMRIIPESTTVVIELDKDSVIHFVFSGAQSCSMHYDTEALFSSTILIAFFKGCVIHRLLGPAYYKIENSKVTYAKLIIDGESKDIDEFHHIINDMGLNVSYHTYTLLNILTK